MKEDNHRLKNENIKLKTRVLFLDKEIDKRDKLVEQTISTSSSMVLPKRPSIILKTSLINNLKRQLRISKDEINELKKELEKHQKSRKTTAINELESTVEVLTLECQRLRNLLTEQMKKADQVNYFLFLEQNSRTRES